MGGEGETLMFSKFSVLSFVLLAEYTMMGAGIVISNKSKKYSIKGLKYTSSIMHVNYICIVKDW